MKAKIKYDNFQTETVNFADDAVGFYTDMAQYITRKCIFLLPNKYDETEIRIETEKGSIELTAKNRSGSITIFEKENGNNMDLVMPDKFEPRYLKMLNAENNNYKFYKLEMINNNPNKIQASWGRIGDKESKAYNPYSLSSAIIKASEKLEKGYKDFSEIYYDEIINPQDYVNEGIKIPDNKPKTKNEIAAENLYNQLLHFSERTIEENFLSNHKITKAMIKECKNLYNNLIQAQDVTEFNRILKDLMLTAERKVDKHNKIGKFFAESPDDFKRIIDREESILMSMQVVNIATENTNTFPNYLKVRLATKKERDEVINQLDISKRGLVAKVYKVVNKETNKKFQKYIKENNIQNIKYFWHGSRNQNWLSIAETGLLLNPNAIITGKMYGNGIYFSSDSDKSWGYTSGGYWTGEKGKVKTKFMALYETAYGTPQYEYGVKKYTEKDLKDRNKDCVHALGRNNGGSALKRDEIIFFNESAVNIKYLVEFQEPAY